MKEFGWKENYLEHRVGIDTEYLPYATWVFLLKEVDRQRAFEAYQKWELAAFIGYQNYLISPDKKKPYLDYKKWLTNMGVKPPKGVSGKAKSRQVEIEKARKALTEAGFGELIGSLQFKRGSDRDDTERPPTVKESQGGSPQD